MPAPTPVPERTRPVPASSPPPPRRPMSMERRYRLRRTMALAGLLVVLFLLVKLVGAAFGDDTPAASAKTSPTAAGASPSASSSGSATASASASASAGTQSARAVSVPASGDGKLSVLTVPGSDSSRTGKKVTFSVEAEGGLGVDLAQFASTVRQVLGDERGWEAKDSLHFELVDKAKIDAGTVPDVRITLASPKLTDELCAPLRTNGEVSCNRHGRAVINAKRWGRGVEYYKDLSQYRIYIINHEVGHSLWHPHETCPAKGQPAPIMLQQTLGLQGCTAWPWPTKA